ncbi:hypothetical protein A4A49_13458 [Nicotiana attenuata]|uniref:Uncharacterized protein n=1 Tax=Nicotiana attenuata TaxID=49451 RepID=A0A314L2Y4_NICAT|nr:hypothetical protein A4A49_13458 [Nicotiana attenuata]
MGCHHHMNPSSSWLLIKYPLHLFSELWRRLLTQETRLEHLYDIPTSSSSTALVTTNIPKAEVSPVITSFSRGNGRSGRVGRNGGRW